jgi:hypothetical protein
MRRILLIIGVVAVVCCVGAIVVVVGTGLLVGGAIKPVNDRANEFLTALRTDDYGKAYSLISADQQTKFGGSPDGLKQFLEQLGMADPTSWNMNNVSINNNVGTIGGTCSFKDGSTKKMRLDLMKVGDNWLIENYSQDQQ